MHDSANNVSNLGEIRKSILAKMEELRERIKRHTENSEEFKSRERPMYSDNTADMVIGDDIDDKVVNMLKKELSKHRKAYDRTFHRDYGICEDCGEEIPAKRLRKCLLATKCIDCQETFEKQRVALVA